MIFINKLIRADDIRFTRWHTEDGSFCGLRALLGMIPSLLSWLRSRVTGRYLIRPWWVWQAIGVVEAQLLPSDRVLEIGSGYSTLWLAQRCEYVLSIEESPEWMGRVLKEARTLGLDNLDLISGNSRELVRQQIQDKKWDVVIIDGPSERLEIFQDLIASDARPRMVIYDDTDKAENRTVLSLRLDNYRWLTFRGFKPQTLHACETSIFFRKFS